MDPWRKVRAVDVEPSQGGSMRNRRIWASAFVCVCILSIAAVLAQRAGAPRALTGQDYAEIQQLQSKYMFAIDDCQTGRPYAYSDLYTNDGTFMAGHGTAENAVDAQGREDMARFGIRPDGKCWSQGALPGLDQTFHLNLPAAIYATPEGARGKSWLLELHGVTGTIRYAGWYDDVYVRTAAGWRFKSRNHRTDFSILYDTRVPGWDKEHGYLDRGV